MPIHPKFFNRFMMIVAAITAVIIVISTLRHAQVNKQDFETQVSSLDISEIVFERIQGTVTDTLHCGEHRPDNRSSSMVPEQTNMVPSATSAPSATSTTSNNSLEPIRLESCFGRPIILAFWATWSGMSQEMNQLIVEQNPNVTIIAAAVRDDVESVIRYSQSVDAPFLYVDGTDLFHQIKATGVPSQIFIDQTGTVTDLQIGKDAEALKQKIDALQDGSR